MVIRLVTFDALHTIITPRLPIFIQYSQTFSPYIGDLKPKAIKNSFKIALKELQIRRPAYRGDSGLEGWWTEVIKRTALGAGGNPKLVQESLPQMVSELMTRFSSKEGYKLFEDVIPTLNELRTLGIKIAVVSNADSRTRNVFQDLDILSYFSAISLSEEAGVEKPFPSIFGDTLKAVNAIIMRDGGPPVMPRECCHIGDELECDYQGAKNVGWESFLLRRPDYEYNSSYETEDLKHVDVISNLDCLVQVVKEVS